MSARTSLGWLAGVVVAALVAAPALHGQPPQATPRLARVDVRTIDGQDPVLEVVANAPLAFKVLQTAKEKRLDVRIYGVEAGLVPLEQPSALGRVALIKEKRGNLLLRLTSTHAATFDVRAGGRPNVIEIRVVP